MTIKKTIIFLLLASLISSLSACKEIDRGSSDNTVSTTSNETITSVNETNETNETSAQIEFSPNPITRPVSFEDIPNINVGSKKTEYDCGDGVYMKHATMVLGGEYLAYQQTVEAVGYRLIKKYDVRKNHFAAYEKDGICLRVNYFAASSEMSSIVMPYNPYEIYGIYGDTEAEGNIEPQIMMPELNFSVQKNGMCYIIRTKIGSFIIIDGGWGGQGEANKIHDFLKEQVPKGEKPVIAAWILTHPHADHIGAIAEFSSLYYDSVILKRVIYNFINDDYMNKSDSGAMMQGNSYYGILKKALANKSKWQYSEVIKPHTGDVLYIDGIKIDILHTHEEVYPDTKALLYNNSNCMAFIIHCGEVKTLITGDLSLEFWKKDIIPGYGDYLKCDILQPVHHGRTHGSIDLYSIVSPSVCLWPTSKISFDEYRDKDYNVWLMKNVKTNYFCYDGTVTLSLITLKKF